MIFNPSVSGSRETGFETVTGTIPLSSGFVRYSIFYTDENGEFVQINPSAQTIKAIKNTVVYFKTTSPAAADYNFGGFVENTESLIDSATTVKLATVTGDFFIE